MKAFDCVDHNKVWKIFKKRWEYQTTLPVSCETCMWVKKQQLEPDKNNGLVQNCEWHARLYIVILI